MTESLARRERRELSDLVLDVGDAAPTCCAGWNSLDLVAHLLVRERSVASIGIAVPPLSGVMERAMDRYRRRGLDELVALLRAPQWTPVAIPLVDRLINTTELFVHHEDVRRARPDWTPRQLARSDEDTLWRQIRLVGHALVRPAGAPVVVQRSDVADRSTLRRGQNPLVLTGLPSELLLLLFDRPSHGVQITGPPAKVARFRASFDRLTSN